MEEGKEEDIEAGEENFVIAIFNAVVFLAAV